MAGTVIEVLFSFGGLKLEEGEPQLEPVLPAHWDKVEFSFTFRGSQYQATINSTTFDLRKS